MKRNTLARTIGILTFLAAIPAALAQTPALLTCQGRVQTGTPAADFTGTGQFKFAFVAGDSVISVQATATVTRFNNNTLNKFTMTNEGAGYVSAPAVTITGGGGSGATATAVLTEDRVTSIILNTPGSGYTSIPTVTIAAPPPRQRLLWVNNGASLTADPVNAVSLPVTNGLYSVMLGDTSIPNMAAIPPSVFANPDVRLRVWFNGTQLTPDQRLAPNGYLPGGTTVNGNFNVTNGGVGGIALGDYNGTNSRYIGIIRPGDPGNIASGSGFSGVEFGGPANLASSGFVAFHTHNYGNSGAGEKMRIDKTGNVGIGTNAPAAKLDVNGTINASGDIALSGEAGHSITVGRQTANLTGNPLIIRAGEAGYGDFAKPGGDLWLVGGKAFGSFEGVRGGNVSIVSGENAGVGGNGSIFLQPGTGSVGINTSDVSRAKLVVGGSASSKAHPNATYGFLDNDGAHAASAAVPNANSIYGEWTIWAGAYIIASSDERIKNIQGHSNSVTDLKTLMAIEVTDYHYKDTVTKGAEPQKKLIAQQVEKVFPMAVSRQTDVIPDIFRKASIKDGWISLKTDLKKGERVRLTDDKTMAVHEVLEVTEDKFRTDFQPEGNEVFVYGREVNDFRTVDYDAVAMLNVSATQELARKLDAKDAEVLALQKENAALKAELAANAAQDKAQDAKLAAAAAQDQAQDAKLAALAALIEKQSTTITAGVATVPDKH